MFHNIAKPAPRVIVQVIRKEFRNARTALHNCIKEKIISKPEVVQAVFAAGACGSPSHVKPPRTTYLLVLTQRLHCTLLTT